jgi:hypothetical protein
MNVKNTTEKDFQNQSSNNVEEEDRDFVQVKNPNKEDIEMKNTARHLLNSLDDIHEEVDRIMKNCNIVLDRTNAEYELSDDIVSNEEMEPNLAMQQKNKNRNSNSHGEVRILFSQVLDEADELLKKIPIKFSEDKEQQFIPIFNWGYFIESSYNDKATKKFITFMESSFVKNLSQENCFSLVNRINLLLHIAETKNMPIEVVCKYLKNALLKYRISPNFDFDITFSQLDDIATPHSIQFANSFYSTVENTAEKVESFFDNLLHL